MRCMLFTSGTTGVPKGVAIRQRNLLNLVHAWSTELQLGDNEVFLQHANIVLMHQLWRFIVVC